ncbi:MAG: tetratricopeptide repeat protein [Myxococcales bacterium]
MKTALVVLAGLLATTGRMQVATAQGASAPVMCLAGPALAHDDARRIDHLARAHELEAAGDVAGAIAETRRAAYDRPGRAEYELLARLAQKAGDQALAMQALGALADAAPEDAEPLLKLARAFVEAGDTGAAAEAATEAAERNPLSAEAWHLKGRAELQRGRLSEAIAAFERTVRLNPRHAWAYNNLGYARLLARQPEKAVQALERARQLAPHLAYVHNNLGVAYEELGRLDDAQLAFGKALDLEPGHPSAAASFARTAEALGWAGPAVEARPDAGAGIDGGESGDWAEEFEPATVAERSWLFEPGPRAAGDEPSGADLREQAPVRPLGVAAGVTGDGNGDERN